MSTSVCWELICDGLVSRAGGVKDFHPLNTTETEDKIRLHGRLDLATLAIYLRMKHIVPLLSDSWK